MTNANHKARFGLGRHVFQSRLGAFLLVAMAVVSTTNDGTSVSAAFRMLSVAAWMMLSLMSSCALLHCGAVSNRMTNSALSGLNRILLNTFYQSSAFYLVNDVHDMLQFTFVLETEGDLPLVLW
jgi:hypothetical protein